MLWWWVLWASQANAVECALCENFLICRVTCGRYDVLSLTISPNEIESVTTFSFFLLLENKINLFRHTLILLFGYHIVHKHSLCLENAILLCFIYFSKVWRVFGEHSILKRHLLFPLMRNAFQCSGTSMQLTNPALYLSQHRY